MVALSHAFEGQSLMGVMYKIVEGNLPEWPAPYSEDLHGVFQRSAFSLNVIILSGVSPGWECQTDEELDN